MVTSPALITGATGGLGRILTGILRASGRDVIATGRDPVRGKALSAMGARFIAADLARDDLAPLVEGVGTVFHLAALSSPWGPRADFIAANQTATRRLIDAAQQAGAARFLFASTPSIYTRAAHQIGLTENSPLPSPLVNDYASTKYAAEQMVLAAAAPGFDTAALRPRAIISPYDTALLPRLLRAAQSGRMPLPGRGQALIEPTDARDVCAALLAAEARSASVSGRAFNISGGHPVALADLARHVFDRLNRPVRLIPLPAPLVLALAHVAEGAARLRPGHPEPTLTVYAAKALGWSQSFDLSAARDALGWSPAITPFDAIDWALQERGDA